MSKLQQENAILFVLVLSLTKSARISLCNVIKVDVCYRVAIVLSLCKKTLIPVRLSVNSLYSYCLGKHVP